MNCREMHFEVNLYLQKVAAARTRKFLPDEVDIVLNKVLGRYIRSKLRLRPDGSGGYSVEQMDLDAIRPLLVTKYLPAYIFDDQRYVSYLPPDYSYLIDDGSTVHELCGQIPQTQDASLDILSMKQLQSTKELPKFYESMMITMGNKTLTIPGDLPTGQQYTGYLYKTDVTFIVPFILAWFRKRGVPVYWERYNDIYLPGSYIVPAPAGSVGSNYSLMMIDGNNMTQIEMQGRSLVQHTGAGIQRANRLTSSSLISDLQQTAFFKSSALSPLSELVDSNLYVYRDESLTVNNVRVTYVRKPQAISLLLGTDCDLAEEYHQGICDLAVAYLKGTLENQTGQALTEADLERRVTL